MKKRQLGKDGPMVSEIGLGCWSFAGSYGATDEKESHATLAAALDMGIDFLDTANVYGMGVSEQVIGSFIKGDVAKFKIATKAGIARDPETGARGFNNSKNYLIAELDKSLSRLGVKQIALYYMHRRDPRIEIEEVMDTLLEFQRAGKIGGIGFSEISPASLRRACAVGPVMAVQNEYSLWSRYPDLGLIQTCRELGVAFVPFSPLARGMLTSNPPKPEHFPASDFRKGTPRFTEPNFSFNIAKVDEFVSLAADLNTTPAALAIAWCLGRGEHLIPIPGTRTAAHLKECAAGSDFSMTDAIMDQIESVLPVGWAHGDRYSRDQWLGPEGYC
ncbi:MAG: aldo/keto reductase [Pseudomonadota bacterium]